MTARLTSFQMPACWCFQYSVLVLVDRSVCLVRNHYCKRYTLDCASMLVRGCMMPFCMNQWHLSQASQAWGGPRAIFQEQGMLPLLNYHLDDAEGCWDHVGYAFYRAYVTRGGAGTNCGVGRRSGLTRSASGSPGGLLIWVSFSFTR